MSETPETNKADGGESRSTAGLERTVITQEEFNSLIIAANPDEFLQCTFGSHICLQPADENRWAFKFLADLRSNLPHEGRPD